MMEAAIEEPRRLAYRAYLGVIGGKIGRPGKERDPRGVRQLVAWLQ